MSEDFLQVMAHHSRERVEQAKRDVPIAKLQEMALELPSPPALKLSADAFDLIAELKTANSA